MGQIQILESTKVKKRVMLFSLAFIIVIAISWYAGYTAGYEQGQIDFETEINSK